NGLFWDENSGPSSAEQNSVGTIPSESFTLMGDPVIPTSTTLLVSPDSASVGQVVTLAATVLDQFSNLVTIGTVTLPEGTRVLGTVQAADAAQTALLQTRFAPGNYSITAVYNPNNNFEGSQSPAEPLSVSGTEPTLSTLTAADNHDGTYNFSL